MTKREKQKILRTIQKAEDKYRVAESEISALTKFVQPYFDKEVSVCPSPDDGAIITDDKGTIGISLRDFINAL
ncbi:hypothetical protein [Marinoscillum furvescens]|uniref:Uncharacterized protein n=1 Tax=Marinoscillum furvescens DSM 4134 TaxID=1122208 RepID=A0A3D9L522_MARFU|nr:hypothetical protein [Marinoscillum furvescens]REE01123.1 hypothetical protein C7460_104143 [Marinoscillum furvescens DSM 4134]